MDEPTEAEDRQETDEKPGGADTEAGLEKRRLRSYVLRQARLTTAQERAYERYGSKFLLPFAKERLDFAAAFGNSKPVVVEIGFGMGHATAEIAASRPDLNFLGLEVHKPGVGALMLRLQERGLENVRIVHHDAVEVFEFMISPKSLAGIHIFFPDPWQKKRHHKRRLLKQDFLNSLAEKSGQGAYLYIASDWEDYAQWILREIEANLFWRNRYEDFAPPLPWRPETSFEKKGLAKNHVIREILADLA